MSIEKVSHIGVVMWWHTIMLKATFFIWNQNIDARYVLPCQLYHELRNASLPRG
jgi:hypothetical protein